MIKTYHEAPISIFKEVQEVTYGDYALVHLFESSEAYFQMFKQAVRDGRDVILDNSLFELREAFDAERYVYWIKRLEPTWYIVPDSWKNSAETVKMFHEFVAKYPNLPGKRIGVAQGLGLEDTAQCYKSIEPLCDKVAFNFDGSVAWKSLTKISMNKYLDMSAGRRLLISLLDDLGVINHDKPHHLLGCGVPQEMALYTETWIDSVDTSNPVMWGLLKKRYLLNGMDMKPSEMMANIMHINVTESQLHDVIYNIGRFQDFCLRKAGGEIWC